MEIERTERGWAGHFICANRCRFRRNTLLRLGDVRIVVSTVGLMEPLREGEPFQEIGLDRHYETMVFHADPNDTRYYDADVTAQIFFDSPWAIEDVDADDSANEMHETVVSELTERLKSGEFKGKNEVDAQ